MESKYVEEQEEEWEEKEK